MFEDPISNDNPSSNFDEEGVDPADITVLIIFFINLDDNGTLQGHKDGSH